MCMTVGSLFSGIGGIDLGCHSSPNGEGGDSWSQPKRWKAAYMAEYERGGWTPMYMKTPLRYDVPYGVPFRVPLLAPLAPMFSIEGDADGSAAMMRHRVAVYEPRGVWYVWTRSEF